MGGSPGKFVLHRSITVQLTGYSKGKIERPYRWLQDRIVRTCALENITEFEEVRGALHDEVDRYHNHQVHSTTGEIPSIRFDQARKSGVSLFPPFTLPKPYTSPEDVFCLREMRILNGYGRISLFNHEIPIPHVPVREEVELHMVPDVARQALEVRIWFENQMVHSLSFPIADPSVHF